MIDDTSISGVNSPVVLSLELSFLVYPSRIELFSVPVPLWVVRREEMVISSEVVGRGGWGEVSVAKFRAFEWPQSVSIV